MSDGDPLSEHVTIRFPESLAIAAKYAASQDGMDTSAWIRRVVDREVAVRSGRCPTCGTQATPAVTGEGAGHG